jgi:hypothetical protein
MSSVVISGDSSGTITLSAPATAGSNTLTLPASTGTVGLIAQGTAVASTSGTSIDFTSIPSWVKQITVMFNGVSTSGTSIVKIQLGTSGGIQTTGYGGTVCLVNAGGGAASAYVSSAGFEIERVPTAASTRYGSIVLNNFDTTGGNWVCTGAIGYSDAVSYNSTAGGKSLAAQLTQVRITTTNGTDTFDAGSINITYQG